MREKGGVFAKDTYFLLLLQFLLFLGIFLWCVSEVRLGGFDWVLMGRGFEDV